MALTLSPAFDLKKTYFMISGIAGINPEVTTICSVTFARFAVQVALQYEFDAREIPSNFSTGYVPLGATSPQGYPVNIYGTEVFEVNAALQQIAVGLASTAKLNDSDGAAAYRANYAGSVYPLAAEAPTVVACDSATSDNWFSGALLSEAMGNYTKLVTNGTGNYCTTAQEDNATLEAMVRAAKAGLVDYSRVIVMRTGSDFDRPPPNLSILQNLFYIDQGAFLPSLANIYLAGIKVVEGILDGWDARFEKGIKPSNYIGDIFATLGGKPDFGPPDVQGSTNLKRRDATQILQRRSMHRRA